MKMCDYFEAFRNKWVSIHMDTGTGLYYQGVVKDVGEDYLLILTTERENPTLIPFRHIVAFKEMHVNANGKPKLFG